MEKRMGPKGSPWGAAACDGCTENPESGLSEENFPRVRVRLLAPSRCLVSVRRAKGQPEPISDTRETPGQVRGARVRE